MDEQITIYTIGHSAHPIADFLKLLKTHEINAIADVRSSPYSKFIPQYNRELLRKSLADAGVDYVFLGEELGARRSESECYLEGQVIYDLIAKTSAFQEGIERVTLGARKMRIAMMCAEKDPLTCHRAILVSRHIKSKVGQILHILEDGSIETHTSAEERLLRECKLQESDLFKTPEQLIDDAYTKRGAKIAYVEETQEGT
jgi:uncharacterized protein (DUF488 family)